MQKGQVICIIEAMKLMNEIEVRICFIFYPVCNNSSVSFPLCILILLLPFPTACCSLTRICEKSSSPYATSYIHHALAQTWEIFLIFHLVMLANYFNPLFPIS